MKFALASDLHLVWGSLILDNTQEADVLILAGDIYEAVDLPTLEYHFVYEFFLNIARQFPLVLWVAGNHEHYDGDYLKTHNTIRAWLASDARFSNIKFIEQETVDVNGVLVHGTTLWTDYNKFNPIDVQAVLYNVEDYNYIQNNGYRLSPDTVYSTHVNSVQWIKDAIDNARVNLVVTHHQPCSLSIDPRFRDSTYNSAYYTELSDLIFDNPRIRGWCAGHTHRNLNYEIGDCRVLCNPRGYLGREKLAREFELKYFTIDEKGINGN